MKQGLIPAARTLTLVERELGGREAIIQALVTAPQSKEVRYVLGLLADPENQNRSLAKICQEAHILPGHLLELVEKGQKLAARVVAGQIIAQGTPAVVRDVMQKAAPHELACPDCAGTGKITPDPTEKVPNPEPQDCKVCRATGRLLYDADSDARKLALEMAGLTAKGGGISIGIQTNVQTNVGAGFALETLQEAMDQVLYGRRTPAHEAVEAEIISGPDREPQDGTADQ